ncbi:MAG: hypothetical protein L0Z49_08020 [Actinobacteria bacterium]|nr:hypothetical protein [Actinomycetota bacterium]MCI0544377.1 hypothetical protein [Actinomycetota bacterium]
MREGGHAAVELALAVGVLMLPVALVVSSFGPWSERRVLAEAVAAESARSVALTRTHEEGLAVVIRMTDAHGLAAGEVRLGWCGADPGPVTTPTGVCPLTRGSVVGSTVEVWAPLVVTPWGPVGGLWVRAGHHEPIDLYRSLP